MIIKTGNKEPHTIIANKALNDNQLSAGAIATLVYLMSKPDDWKIYNDNIAQRFNSNKRTTKKYIDELIANGYMKQSEVKHKDSKSFYEYDVSDNPCYISRVHILHENDKKSDIKIKSNVKSCINDLQMYMDMYRLIPSEPIKNIKPQIKLVIESGISSKIFALYGLDYMHGFKANSIVNIQDFIADAIKTFIYTVNVVTKEKQCDVEVC
jgi:predicted transcriptional regulator